MESRRYYTLVAAALGALALSASPAGAERRDVGATVTEDGIREMIAREYANGFPGVPGGGDGGGAGGGGGGQCEWDVRPYPYTGAEPPASVGEPPTPEHRLYLIYCDGEYVATEWLGPGDGGALSGAITTLVNAIKDTIVPSPLIGVKPEAKGVTGIPSLFWVEGYRGETITDSLSAAGVTVEVEATLGSVTWDFGDGTPAQTAGLGEPWPERSSVRHGYVDKGSYSITVTLRLPARFRVNGGAWQGLAELVRTATIPYVVDEVQAVRNR